MGDKIHPTHFQVPEMPYKKKEKEAILMFKRVIKWWNASSYDFDSHWKIQELINNNKDLVEWVMKYKGE